MYKAEVRHWWYLGMHAITRGILDRYIGRGNALTILDAGCGTGAVLDYLKDYGTPSGVDFSPEALRFCRSRGLYRLSQASVTELPFPDNTFDLITSFDVLSECGPVKDEQGTKEFFRVLKLGGHLQQSLRPDGRSRPWKDRQPAGDRPRGDQMHHGRCA